MPHNDKLLNLCRTLINDGVIVPGEVHQLNAWLTANPQYATRFPGQQIAARLKRIYADAKITDEERLDLLHLLHRATRTEAKAESILIEHNLMFDFPNEIHWLGRYVCFGGKFVSGSSRWLQREIEERGGAFHELPDPSTNCVVIGSEGGLAKIFVERLEKFRPKVQLLTEEHWLNLLGK